jgi:hypothetical protein
LVEAPITATELGSKKFSSITSPSGWFGELLQGGVQFGYYSEHEIWLIKNSLDADFARK